MANGGGQVLVTLGANNQPLKDVLGESVSATQQAAGDVQRSWERAGEQGGGGVEAIEKSLKGFARTARTEGRMIGFMTAQLTEAFGGLGKEGKEAVNSLAGAVFAFASDNPILGIMELVKGGAVLWRLWGEAGAKATEEQKKKTEELTGLLKKQREELEKIRFLNAGGTENTWEAEKQRRDSQSRLDFLNKEISLAENMKAGGTDFAGKSSELTKIANIGDLKGEGGDQLLEYLGKLYEERNRMVQDLNRAKDQAIATDNAEAAKKLAEEEKRKQEEERKRLEEHHKKLLEEEKKYQDAFRKAQQGFSLSAWQTSKGVDYSQSQGGVLNLRDGHGPVSPEAYAAAQHGETSSNLWQKGGYGAGQGYADPDYISRLQKVGQELTKQQEQWKSISDTIEKGVTQSAKRAFKDIVNGSKSVGDAVKDMFVSIGETIVDMLLDMAGKWLEETLQNLVMQRAATSTTNVAAVTSDAAVAAAATMASISAIPIVGPAMAPGMAAEQYSMTMAYAPMAAAEGGWELPKSGGPFPMFGHQGERMLNKKQNNDYADTQDVLHDIQGKLASGQVGGTTVDLRGAHIYGKTSFEEIVKASGRGVNRGLHRAALRGAR
jgi:hypothetical protein